jgi:hypothetical protein
MAQLIDLTSSILSQNTICFETRNLDSEKIPVPIEDAKFGILNLSAVTSNETNDELDILFTVDCSGSMSDMCSDLRTKMQHIIHTLKNMIIFFHERPHIKINITIHAFDTIIYEVVTRTCISDENINDIILKVDKISPRGSTNIELALEESYRKIAELKRLYPDNTISHIFMTDGEATEGSKVITTLQSKIDSDVTNAFIGFGIEHDSVLLNGISSIDKSNYYFIDKLENAGLVYGEILHSIIYKVLDNVEIIIENGFIYNFKKNEWTTSLKIGDIVSESNKIFNIISSNPDECKAFVKGSLKDLIVMFPATKLDEESLDLSCHIYRQRTLQLLYEVNDFCSRKREKEAENQNNNIFQIVHNEDIFVEEKKTLKSKLANLIEEIKKYMNDNSLNDDKILKNLCDDIYICYRTLGTKFGSMFCTARQTSQGTQRQYTASHTIDTTEHLFASSSRRQIARSVLDPILIRQSNPFNIDIDDDIHHEVSDFGDAPYLTPQATQVMREISKVHNYDELSESTQQLY